MEFFFFYVMLRYTSIYESYKWYKSNRLENETKMLHNFTLI